MVQRRVSVVVALACLSGLHLASVPSWAQTTALYPELDHVQGTLVQTAAAPVRPVLVDGNFEVWAVNTGLSTVERFKAVNVPPFAPAPLDVRHVPWGPVSIALWDDPSPSIAPELLIVCRNTWGLLRMDRATGAYKEFIALPAEPSDIVVDSVNHRAFVSCTGADAVVRIDLLERDGAFHARYDEETTEGALRIKSPYFLHLESNGRVRVAPLHSGNNTTVTGTQFGNVDRVISVADREFALPDEDLFEIDPSQPEETAVSVVATGVGTILFGHGRNPVGGAYWMLNTEALNAPPGEQSEPALNADFVDNRATVLGSPHEFVLFDLDAGAPFSATNAIGQPFSLTFDPLTGRAFVGGLLTHNVTMLDGQANHLLEIDLPDGSIPRGIALAPGDTRYVLAYCWGTAQIEAFLINHALASATPVGTYTLSHDPLPDDLKEGRQIFFDGELSARKNVSCASCHVDGGSDFLVWNLSGQPFDDKGPMVTQTLVGLERVGPFHWRGERTLEDFNTFAFPGLLGQPSLPEAEFAKLKAWLFALKNPANPYQDRDRVLDANPPSPDFIAPTQTAPFVSDLSALEAANSEHPLVNELVPVVATATDAVVGLRHWLALEDPENDIVFERRWACVQCHAFPVGTNNDVTDDEDQVGPVLPERMHLKNTPFHEIWRKKQSLVAVDTGEVAETDDIDVRTFLGAGVAHTGSVPDPLRFAQIATANNEHGRDFTLRTAALLQQWDQGLAPAAHYACWLNSSMSQTEITEELVDFLLFQASAAANPNGIPNCDIAVIQFLSGSRRAWYLNRSLVTGSTISRNDAVFTDDGDVNGTNDHRSLQWFVDQAKKKFQTIPPTPLKPSLVLGLPVGAAERFAADYDMDGKRNQDEPSAMFTIDPAPDATPPIITSELGFVSTNVARVFVRTDEPTTVTVTYNEVGSTETQSVESLSLSRVHALILTNLRPSTSPPVTTNLSDPDDPPLVPSEQVGYDWTIDALDASGNPQTLVVTNALPTGTEAFSIPRSTDVGIGSPTPQLRLEHVLTGPPSVSVGAGAPGTGDRAVLVDLAATLEQGGGSLPATNVVFAVRAYRIRGTGDPLALTVDNGGLVSASVGTDIVDALMVTAGALDRFLALENPSEAGLLIVNRTPANNAATLSFTVGGALVAAGDEVVVQVEAVVQSSTSADVQLVSCPIGPGPCRVRVLVPFLTALSQWNFPRTGEANAQGRGTAPTP